MLCGCCGFKSGRRAGLAIFRKDLHTFITEQHHVIRLFLICLFHPWRPNRHAWNSQTTRDGALKNKALDIGCRNMPLNDITIYYGCVAGLQVPTHAIMRFDRREILHLENVNVKAFGFYMLYPRATAATQW